MTMKEKLTQEIIKAMKDKDTLKKSFLQLIKSSVENLEIKNKKGIFTKKKIKNAKSKFCWNRAYFYVYFKG